MQEVICIKNMEYKQERSLCLHFVPLISKAGDLRTRSLKNKNDFFGKNSFTNERKSSIINFVLRKELCAISSIG